MLLFSSFVPLFSFLCPCFACCLAIFVWSSCCILLNLCLWLCWLVGWLLVDWLVGVLCWLVVSVLVVVPLTRLHPVVFCLDVSLPIVFILVAFQHWLLVWVDVSCFVALSCSYSLACPVVVLCLCRTLVRVPILIF